MTRSGVKSPGLNFSIKDGECNEQLGVRIIKVSTWGQLFSQGSKPTGYLMNQKM